jgi:hypothetical protein
LNEGKRLLSVFIAPGALFEDLRERPRWVVPFLVTIFVAALALVLPRLLIPADVWLEAIRESLPEGVSMSAEQMTLMSQQMRSPLALGGIALSGIIVNVLLTFVCALVFWALFALFGRESSYKKALSVVGYSGLITAFGVLVLAVLSILLQRVDVTTSLAFLPFLERGTFLYRFLAQIDFFAVWRVIVMGAGFAVVMKAGKPTSYIVVIVLWLALCLGLAALRFGAVAR